MKKRILFGLLLLIGFFSQAATKITLDSKIQITFEACSDGSIRIEAVAPKGYAPVKDLELKKEPSSTEFTTNSMGHLKWGDYTIIPKEEGYSIYYNQDELYESTLKEDKKVLREIRRWNQARQFYGFGEACRYANLSNQSFVIYNVSKYGDHANLFIPFYVTETNVAVYYNANGKDWIYFQHGQDPQGYTSEYKRIECFVRQDSSRKESIQKFYKETESLTMMPKWAFGYIQSKYGYKSRDEVIKLVEDFKQRQIPLSAVVLDLYWFKKMGDISWTSPDFENPYSLNNFMEQNGVKLITITEPFFTTGSQNYKELASKKLITTDKSGKPFLWRDWWVLDSEKEGGLFNPLGKKASDFMGEKYYQMLETGIDGFWTDLGEPEGAKPELVFGKYTENEFHNYYNYYWSKALYEGVKKHDPNTRLFIMSRSGYTGSGKYNVSVWSGDVTVSWPSLKQQIAYGINAGASGLAYWGSDVGGFTPEKSPAELYTRWQQFGSFTPIYRAHGTGPREPYAYEEPYCSIVSDVIRTRQTLIPYIYSTARQTMNGLPMMRAMYLEDENTPLEYMGTQYMFGDSILVSPIYVELQLESAHQTYLPKGTWYDFYTDKKVTTDSNGIVTTNNTIEKIPVFVKEGAIIPLQKNNTNILKVYATSQSKNSFTLYNDDGLTESYKEGNFSELILTLNGTTLKASINGERTFLSNNYKVINAITGKEQTVTLNQLLQGVQL